MLGCHTLLQVTPWQSVSEQGSSTNAQVDNCICTCINPLPTGLFRFFDMSPQLLLFLSQRGLLLSSHRPATQDHHDWLISGLFTVRRTARRVLVLLPFV